MQNQKIPKGMMYLGDMDKLYVDPITRTRKIKTFGVAIEYNSGDHYLIDKTTGTPIKYEKYVEQLQKLLRTIDKQPILKTLEKKL